MTVDVLPKMQISDRLQAIPEALSIYINNIVYEEKRRGKDVITLSLGEAFFDIPNFDFRDLDFVKGYHYSESRGIPDLRAKIADFYRTEYRATVDPKSEVLISAGSKCLIFMAMQATLNAGEQVLIHEPAWLSYQEQARLLDVEVDFIPFDAPVDTFETYFTPATRMVVINNPNNPAGRLYTAEEIRSLYRQCRARGIYILVDEAYSDFVLDEEFNSIAGLVPDKDGIILVNSLSKNMGMSGWRIGYVIGSPALIDAILKLNQHIITCAPTILQLYLARYFDEITSITLPQVAEVVRKRRAVAEMMDELGLKRLQGESTFYFFVDVSAFPGSTQALAMHLLLNHGIAVVPGSAYGKSTEDFVRISIGTESIERIHRALTVLKDCLMLNTFDAANIDDSVKKAGYHAFVQPASHRRS